MTNWIVSKMHTALMLILDQGLIAMGFLVTVLKQAATTPTEMVYTTRATWIKSQSGIVLFRPVRFHHC